MGWMTPFNKKIHLSSRVYPIYMYMHVHVILFSHHGHFYIFMYVQWEDFNNRTNNVFFTSEWSKVSHCYRNNRESARGPRHYGTIQTRSFTDRMHCRVTGLASTLLVGDSRWTTELSRGILLFEENERVSIIDEQAN